LLVSHKSISGGVGHLSDFVSIHPVISWLIMKSKQYREKWEAQLRNFSVMQFSKDYKIPKEANAGIVSSDLKVSVCSNE
jgi:hypothetical protein